MWCQWGGRPIRRALYLKANGSGVQKWYLDEFKEHLSSEKHQRRLPCPELLPLGDCDPRGSLACRDNAVRVPTRPFAAQAAQILSFCLLNRAGQFDATWRRCGGSFSRQKVGLPARSACDQEQGQSVHDPPPHSTQNSPCSEICARDSNVLFMQRPRITIHLISVKQHNLCRALSETSSVRIVPLRATRCL